MIRPKPGLSRRTVLAALPAAAMAWPARADSAPGAVMLDRARRLLAGFPPDGRREMTFPLGGRTFRRWNFMTGARPAPGVALERMDEGLRGLTLDLVASGLSPRGVAKAERVMLLQDVLRDELGQGDLGRNRLRYCLMIFGAPSDSAPWAWRFEGHHLSLTYTLIGTDIVSVTPSSFSAEPNTVPSGPHRGTVALAEEERLGRRLFASLTPRQRGQALLRDRTFSNVLALAGRESRVGPPAGLPLAFMTAAQSDLARRLLAVYTGDHLPAALAERQAARVAAGGLDAIRFGWAGDPDRGPIYYRLHNATTLVEFATLRDQPQHHHSVRHDLGWNLGAHAL